MCQVVDLLVEDSSDASLRSDSLQELFDAIVTLRNVGVNLLSDLEFAFPHEVDVLVESPFLDDDCVFVDLDFGHHICKLVPCSDL